MKYHNLLSYSLKSVAIAASLGLTACGGGGGGDGGPSLVTLTGTVADGYLSGATVCLDLNQNQLCDTGEPSTTSTTGGSYSLQATQTQVDSYPVVVKVIAGQTIDEDTDTAVIKSYTLSAPAGKGLFVSPLTTMIQAQMAATGSNIDSIERQILISLGQDPTDVSLFDDYVANENDPANTNQDNYQKMHQLAQVIAVHIADNLEIIEEAVANATITIDLTTSLDSVIQKIAALVIAELAAIDTAIDDAVDAGSFVPVDVAVDVVVTVDTDTIEADVAAAEAADSASMVDIQTLFESGLNWIYVDYDEIDYDEIAYGYFSSSVDTITDIRYEWNFDTSTFVEVLPGINEYVLQSDGSWLAGNDGWNNASISFNALAGTATIIRGKGGEVLSNLQSVDLSGINISTSVATISPDIASFIDPAAEFNAGAKAYTGEIAYTSDVYLLGFSDDCTSAELEYTADSGNCNTVVDYSANPPAAITALADMLSETAWVDPGDGSSPPNLFGYIGSDDSELSVVGYELVGSGTSGAVNYYQQTCSETSVPSCTLTMVGTGSWDIVTVNTTDLLMVDHPNELLTTYLGFTDQESVVNHFFAVHEAVVRQGWHLPAGFTDSLADDGAMTNVQAQEDILAAIDPELLGTDEPDVSMPVPDCSYQTPVDMNTGVPIIFDSYTFFEEVVTACGGSMTITDTDVMGTWIDGDGIFSTTTVFEGTPSGVATTSGTGTVTEAENGIESFSADFDWTLENDRVTISIVDSVNPLQVVQKEIIAIVDIDGFQQRRSYAEDAVLSDMNFDTADGFIYGSAPIKQ
ncbi:MAG: hypothetical protein ACN4GM_06180 [Gammaproteobacteria bacterium]